MSHSKVAASWEKYEKSATDLLITTSGKEISLIRHTLVDDGAGGKSRSVETVMEPVRRFFGPVMEDNAPAQSRLGDTTIQQYVLIGPPGDVIEDEDEFFIVGDEDVRYSIDWVDRNQTYQTKAYVKVVTS